MQSRRVNTILWMAAALLGSCALVALAVGALLPLETEDLVVAPTTRPVGSAGAGALAPDLAGFEEILTKPLRQSLTDAAMPTEVGAPSGSLTLAGTVGNSLALIRRADGSVEVKAIGELIDGAEVLAIRTGEVDLKSGGEKLVLKKPKEPGP